MDFNSLNSYQIDVLKEVTNISVGTSISKLSEIMDANVKMSVPNVNIVNLEDVFSFIGDPEEEVYTIFSHFRGEIKGNTFFLFKNNAIKELSNIIDFNTTELAFLEKVGTIITTSFVDSLIAFTGLNIEQDSSHITFDLLGAVLEHGFLEYSHLTDNVIFIKNSFLLDDYLLEGHLVFFPSPIYLKALFLKLGVSYDKD